MTIFAFDIGGTFTKYGVISDDGKILEKSKIPTVHNEEDLLKNLLGLVNEANRKYPDIKGIGISAPGIVSDEGRMITFGALKKMYGLPLAESLNVLTSLPVTVENDANAVAIAEGWQGGAKGLKNYIVMALGTGIGGGIVINGQVYTGAHGGAGEFGWPLYHGIYRRGNIEFQSENFRSSVVSGLLTRYQALANPMGEKEFLEDAVILIERVKSGDQKAAAVWQDYIEDVAINLINLMAIFDPEAILVGGGISESDIFMRDLRNKFMRLIKSHESLNRINEMGLIGEIRRAILGNDAGLLGAAYSVIQKLG